jgi:DNA-binding response OmpR family regulator
MDTRILVVDDSPAIIALMRDMLRAKGYSNVETALTSEDAVKIAQASKPDIVFLDLMMPDTSGIELTKSLLEADPGAHIVLTTALPPSHEAVVMAVSQGAEEYLSKPLRPAAVASVLNQISREGSARHDMSYG